MSAGLASRAAIFGTCWPRIGGRVRRRFRVPVEVSSCIIHPKIRAPVNHWIVALTVTLATFMEMLDTSIANVALPYISGGLAVGRRQATVATGRTSHSAQPGARALDGLLRTDPNGPRRCHAGRCRAAGHAHDVADGPRTGTGMAYLDAFWIFAIMALAALPLVLLMKKSVAQGAVATH